MTIFLQFPDEATFLALLPEGVEPAAEITLLAGSLSVIGTMYDVDNSDPENPVYTPLAGWHVNGLGEIPEGMTAYAIEAPVTPLRTY